jgi:hypothetical protein
MRGTTLRIPFNNPVMCTWHLGKEHRRTDADAVTFEYVDDAEWLELSKDAELQCRVFPLRPTIRSLPTITR